MPKLPIFIVTILFYVICARLSLSFSAGRGGARLFAAGNIAAFIWLSLLTRYDPWLETTILDLGADAVIRHIFLILGYVAFISLGYALMRSFAARDGILPWLAFFYPITILIFVKYLYGFWNPLLERLDWDSWVITVSIVGLSYMAFRLSRLVVEVRNGTVAMPNLSEYLGFAFFLPTLLVGPINSFANHQSSIRSLNETAMPIGRCLFRILIGATKYIYLANLANQLSYTGLFLDGKPHSLIDLAVAAIFYYLFLYCNFSGICDMAIGVAGLIGIRVSENFDNPFAARNVKEFWNRWHITLSEYTREIIFAPLSKFLIKTFGAGYTNLSISIGIIAVFLVIGVWHGVGWRFAIFGLIHAAGVVANHYYTIVLKKRLGKEGFKRYNENLLINNAARVLTFLYVAASFAVFANDRNMLGIIKNALRDGLQF
jgi:D-alanyl-lipoteichoic acid acyltransferase DltB (MBOAT superfamily)